MFHIFLFCLNSLGQAREIVPRDLSVKQKEDVQKRQSFPLPRPAWKSVSDNVLQTQTANGGPLTLTIMAANCFPNVEHPRSDYALSVSMAKRDVLVS